MNEINMKITRLLRETITFLQDSEVLQSTPYMNGDKKGYQDI